MQETLLGKALIPLIALGVFGAGAFIVDTRPLEDPILETLGREEIKEQCLNDRKKSVEEKYRTCDGTVEEKLPLKTRSIKESVPLQKEIRDDYEIEIVELNEIDGGVEVFVKAWTKSEPHPVLEAFVEDGEVKKRLARTIPANTQIGFGVDGTVDIERFVIINPPILVPDENGDIIRTSIDEETGEVYTKRRTENPKEALFQTLEHTLSVIENKHADTKIVDNKRGNTTLTAYPASGTNTPVDGAVWRNVDFQSWSDIRDGVGTHSDNTDNNEQAVRLRSDTTSNTWDILYRTIYGFDTSSVGSDTVSSATFSIYPTVVVDSSFGLSLTLDRAVPASTNALASGDYASSGWDEVRQASDIDFGSLTTSTYNNFSLNATGISNINGSGYSWYGLRADADFDDTAPTWSSASQDYVNVDMADEVGDTTAPKLVVEHAPGGGGTPEINEIIWF